MKIVTVQFHYSWFQDFALLCDVFKESCLTHMPGVKFEDIRIKPPVLSGKVNANFEYNTVKLEIWKNILDKATEPIIFADCDMMALRSAEHAFDIDFDVAFTQRTRVHRIPMNGGIVMARPTEGARQFFHKWYETDKEMLHDKKLHMQWRNKYAGMNQAAFGCVYEQLYLRGKLNLKLHEYKTIEWNAVDCDWTKVNDKTVFVHYKSALRRMVLGNRPVLHQYGIIMKSWYDMRNQLLAKRGEQPKPIEEVKNVGRIKPSISITARQVKGKRYIRCMGGRELKEI